MHLIHNIGMKCNKFLKEGDSIFFVKATKGIARMQYVVSAITSEPLPLIEVGASKVRYRTHLRSLIFKFPPNMTIRQSLFL